MSELPAELVIPLDPPIDAPGGGKVAELQLKEPYAVQVANADRETTRGFSQHTLRRRNIAMISLVSNIPADVVRKMPIGVIRAATDFLQAFLDDDVEAEIDFAANPKDWEMPVSPAIRIGPLEFSTLRLREPTAETVEKAEEKLGTSGTGYALRQYQITLVALTAGVDPAVAGRLRIRELNAASVYIQRFISGGPAIGDSSSPI